MIRGILGVIFGYVALFIVTFITLSATYMTLGAERSFQPGNYMLSPLWLFITSIFALAAAVVGGKVCRVVAGRGWAVFVMAVSALLLGLLAAIPVLFGAEGTAARTGEITMLEAIVSQKAPAWYALLSPFLSAGGVFIGGKKKK
jgi:hypothetical protein